MKRNFLGMAVVGLIMLSMVACSEDSNSKDTVEKLQKFTTTEKGEEKYQFSYNEDWTLTYNGKADSKFVAIKEEEVTECFEGVFGEDCYPDNTVSNGGFIYDLEQDAIRIYFDLELEEGNLQYITYDMGKEEFILTVDLKNKYEPSEELLDWISECDLVDIMEKDVQEFKDQLEENGITFKDLTMLKYDDIDKYIK